MADDTVIDYAYPTMMAEKALRDLHRSALVQDWWAARQQALEAVEWVVRAHAALAVMEQTQA